MSVQPRRIAILGGGVGAMTAVFWLTSREGWQRQYQIDVYQMGWRLGGKGASGRNAALGERIEEHGLHIWFGFYDNAFQLMRQAYAELGRPPGSPLATWDEAFKPQRLVSLTEYLEEVWRVWSILTPLMPGQPGTARGGKDSIADALANLLGWLQAWLAEWPALAGTPLAVSAATLDDALAARAGLRGPQDAVSVAQHAQALLREDSLAHASIVLSLLRWLQGVLHDAGAWLQRHGIWPDAVRRLYLCMDLALAVAIGMLADEVVSKGFEVINDVEFSAWLASHGAQPASVGSAPVRGFYDLVFAYRDGDPRQPDIEAGTMLRGMLKVGLGYRGAIMYKMQAGMGDVVFAPLQLLLERRGVRFHYFHKLTELRPDAAGTRVGEIDLQQQVALRGEGYQPLVEVKGLPCWPSEPLYGQLDPAQAALLQQYAINLESQWSDWPQRYREAFGQPLPTRTLRLGEDFDQVVFGLSVASLADVAAPLFEHSPALRQCSERVAAVATQAYQVWTTPDLQGLGWQGSPADGEEPVLSGFTEPFDTWAPMDQLLCRESWPAGDEPRCVSYFCNAFAVKDYPPYDDHGFPAQCAGQVKAAAIAQLDNDIRALWTNVGAGGFPWHWLVDPAGRAGVARFDAQYWRANVDPSERYVQSRVGTTRFRLQSGQSGLANLFLAGDWLKTGLDAGCVEAAVMGGMQASRALCGWPLAIAGEQGW